MCAANPGAFGTTAKEHFQGVVTHFDVGISYPNTGPICFPKDSRRV
jgi:hypothetical protein